MTQFELSLRALEDLRQIWEFVSEESFEAADHLLEDFYRSFRHLAEMPGIGHKREDLTNRDVRFWPVHSYLIIYKKSKPLNVVRIIHGKRDVKQLMKQP